MSIALTGEPNTTRPAEKDLPRHTGFLSDIKKMNGTINLVFVGDSITDGWRSTGAGIWKKFFADHQALNLGISGDRTEHVLWRLQHGELDGYEARLFVIMIGTNNGDSAPDVAEGISSDAAEKRPGIQRLMHELLAEYEKISTFGIKRPIPDADNF